MPAGKHKKKLFHETASACHKKAFRPDTDLTKSVYNLHRIVTNVCHKAIRFFVNFNPGTNQKQRSNLLSAIGYSVWFAHFLIDADTLYEGYKAG